jgi:O-antigen ligase
MAYASPLPRAAAERSFLPALLIAGLAVLGVVGGVGLAFGEVDAVIVCLSVLGCLAVFFDFRVGAVLLILLLPIEPTVYMPHSIAGLTGLNPINLLEVATLLSFLFSRETRIADLVPKRLFWLYVLPIVVGGLLGAQHVREIPSAFFDGGGVNFIDAAGYLRDMLVKPLTMVLVALLVGAAVTRSKKPENFLIPIIAAVWIMALLAIQFVLFSNITLSQLSGVGERGFFSAIGVHANELGRLFAVAYALLLFVWWESKNTVLKTVLLATMGVLTLALLLTFSRGAFLGFVIVNVLFLLWKFNMRSLALAMLAGVVGLMLMPGAVYDRVMTGFGDGGNLDQVTAGRLDGIWLPLLPELLKSPIWGSGLGSTMWSNAMRNGLMLLVGHPHNAYMEAVLDMGLLGLGLICAYYVHVWQRLRALGSNMYLSPEMRGFFQGAAAGLVAFAITNWAGSSLVPKPEYSFLWLAIGVMYGQLARKPAAS